ncbi:MAG: hypothetical protein MSA22_07105, partial [Prevotella sp.]|nr:hypothetical protein [Prevotella sp.]
LLLVILNYSSFLRLQSYSTNQKPTNLFNKRPHSFNKPNHALMNGHKKRGITLVLTVKLSKKAAIPRIGF